MFHKKWPCEYLSSFAKKSLDPNLEKSAIKLENRLKSATTLEKVLFVAAPL
jgi:hypothetical protein